VTTAALQSTVPASTIGIDMTAASVSTICLSVVDRDRSIYRVGAGRIWTEF
jgi:hypothetical protein